MMKKVIEYMTTPVKVSRLVILTCALFLLANAMFTLAGCTSSADRMAQCESQGVSKDACYLAEQNRRSSINAAAQKQAMENAVNAVK